MRILVVGQESTSFAGKPAGQVTRDLQEHFAVKGHPESIEVLFYSGAKFDALAAYAANLKPDVILTDRFEGANGVMSQLSGKSRIPVMLCQSKGEAFEKQVTTQRLRANRDDPEHAEDHSRVADSLERDTLVFEAGHIHSSYHQMIHHGREKLNQWRARHTVEGEVSLGSRGRGKGISGTTF